MSKTYKKITFSLGALLSLIGITALVSAGITYSVVTTNPTHTAQSVLPERLVNGLANSYNLMKNVYMGELNEEALIDGALSGFVSGAGDTYTSYLNEQEWASLQQTTDSSFEGIGVEIEKSGDYIRVVSPYDNAPASKAGLRTDDLIIGVNGEDVAGQSTAQLASKVRGKKGTQVQLKIRRGTSEFDVTITRDTIPITSVTHRMDTDNKTVGIIRISSFSKTTYDELVTAITELRNQGAKSFVIDVRSNPGGLLTSVEKIINMFIEPNLVMYQMENKAEGLKNTKSSSALGTFKVDEPVTILINKGSASASEIFASALSEHGRAKLVGTTTFGKGTAQSIFKLSEKTGVKITYSKWLTPKGEWVHQKGVAPQYAVDLPEYSQLAVINASDSYTVGEKSDKILNVQKIVNALDYSVSLTGAFDEQTQAAIKQIQAAQQLPVTGELNEETITRLNKLLSEKIKANDTQMKKAVELLTE